MPDPRKRIDIGRKKPDESPVENQKSAEAQELEAFAITGQDLTGADAAMKSMNQIENVIINTYNSLYDPNDRDVYADYLITNLQLYFDEFEDELQKILPEPENPDYEQRKAASMQAGAEVEPEPEVDTGIMDEESDPL